MPGYSHFDGSNTLRVFKPDRKLQGTVALDGSKSISNRALIVLALAGADPNRWLSGISSAADTQTMLQLLGQDANAYNAGDAGTTFRFLTAYLALQPGEQLLTGSARMLERPVGPLVEALRKLGADIRYRGKEGYPPLLIGETKQRTQSIGVAAHVSSQFLTALLLIGPYLPQGLEIVPEGPLVSRPYVEMTLALMRHFGAAVAWRGESLVVSPGAYAPRHLNVEPDWSAASYWYAMAALATQADLSLPGLQEHSWQGDAVLSTVMQEFGVQTVFEGSGVRLIKTESPAPTLFEMDFLDCPDIAQTLAVLCAGLGTQGIFSGLETLSIKETDRIGALQKELSKVGVSFIRLPAHSSKNITDKPYYALEGRADLSPIPRFSTYGDHRMAMAFAGLSMLGRIEIEQAGVVSKSYPQFWEHLKQSGFELTTI